MNWIHSLLRQNVLRLANLRRLHQLDGCEEGRFGDILACAEVYFLWEPCIGQCSEECAWCVRRQLRGIVLEVMPLPSGDVT